MPRQSRFNGLMILTEEQRDAFAVYIARKPESGTVVPGSGGIRKVRWGGRSKGKSGGARIIYFNQPAIGEIWLLTIYAIADRASIPARELKQLKETIERE